MTDVPYIQTDRAHTYLGLAQARPNYYYYIYAPRNLREENNFVRNDYISNSRANFMPRDLIWCTCIVRYHNNIMVQYAPYLCPK